jgi:hypothetical protein
VDEIAERFDAPAFVVTPCYDQLLCVARSERASVVRGQLLELDESPGGALLLAYRLIWRGALGRPDDAEAKEIRGAGMVRWGDQVALPVPWNEDGVLGALILPESADAHENVIGRAWALAAAVEVRALGIESRRSRGHRSAAAERGGSKSFARSRTSRA